MAKTSMANVAVALEVAATKYLNNKDEIEKLDKINKGIASNILDCLDDLKTKSYSFTSNDSDGNGNVKYTFTKAERNKVAYDIAKVKEAIDKKTFNKIVNREFLADYSKLVELAKKYKISKDEIMNCLTINESIDNKKVNELYNVGEIDLNDLKGTFTIDTNCYLTVRKS